jgi:hypothetical protein
MTIEMWEQAFMAALSAASPASHHYEIEIVPVGDAWAVSWVQPTGPISAVVGDLGRHEFSMTDDPVVVAAYVAGRLRPR